MKIYLILTIVFIIGFSVIQIPAGYSSNSKNNSFSYYEKNCNNDDCKITTCDDGESCKTSGSENKVDTDAFNQLSDQKVIDSKALSFMKTWKNFINSED